MTRRTNPTIVIKEVDLDISHICTCNHLVGMDKISCNESSTRKFNEEVQRLSSCTQLWAWSSYTQRKKLKKPSNENLKYLNNVLQCNLNLMKQATYEKGAWCFGGRCSSSLGRKLGKEVRNQCQYNGNEIDIKPMYLSKPKKLVKLDLDKDIDLTMARNLIWISETQNITCILLVGKMQGSKNVYFIVLAPSNFWHRKLKFKNIHVLISNFSC